MAAESDDLQVMLKPFFQRASEAEVQELQAFERLARLEATLAGNKDCGNKELLKSVDELQLKLEDAKAEHAAAKQETMKEVQRLGAENEKLRAENEKLQYRIIHLLQALKDADSKLALK